MKLHRPLCGRPHRRDERASRRVRHQEPAGAGFDGSDHVLISAVRGQDQDAARTSAQISRVATNPSTPGIRMSMRVTSGRSSRARLIASAPSADSPRR
jgi:hypothetical protein